MKLLYTAGCAALALGPHWLVYKYSRLYVSERAAHGLASCKADTAAGSSRRRRRTQAGL